MKYKLIKPVNPNYNAIEQILTNRGIPYEDIPLYMNTTDEAINDFKLLGEKQLKDAATALLATINESKKAIVVVDADDDGFTSSAILINYLHDFFPNWVEENLEWYLHSGKQHGLGDCIEWIIQRAPALVIIPDAGSENYSECKRLKSLGITSIILDHHEAKSVNPYAIVINNQLSKYPNKNFSGAGIVYQFCRYLDSLMNVNNADNYLDLVALGLMNS